MKPKLTPQKPLSCPPRNLKALFRRGVARKELRKWDRARADVQMFIDNGGDATLGAQELNAIAVLETSPPSGPSSYASNDLGSRLENLHLEDDSSSFTVHASAVIQKGEGAFASRDLQRGDLILSETPMFRVPRSCPERIVIDAVENLSPVHLDQFLSLQNSHTDCYSSPILGIFYTNAFGFADDDDNGLCLRSSKFNHSCSPNAKFSFNSNTGQHRIYALGSIPLGEEIFVAYINGPDLYGSPRRSRQAHLRPGYHFTCACSVCSLPGAESKISDGRRVKVKELWDLNLNPNLRGNQPLEDVVNDTVKAIHLLQKEGYLSDADGFMNDAVYVCAYFSDWVSTKYWADLMYHTIVAEFGEDSPRVAEVRGLYLNPRSFPSAGKGPTKKSLAAIRL